MNITTAQLLAIIANATVTKCVESPVRVKANGQNSLGYSHTAVLTLPDGRRAWVNIEATPKAKGTPAQVTTAAAPVQPTKHTKGLASVAQHATVVQPAQAAPTVATAEARFAALEANMGQLAAGLNAIVSKLTAPGV